MAAAADPFATWLADAHVCEQRLTAVQRALLQAAFHFRQTQGTDYYATRLLGHFLLHAGSGLPVAHIARLLRISRPTASRQQGLAAKQVIQQAHHRMDGRPYGKLLPRYAGPIAEFLCAHPKATRLDLLDFISQTWDIRVRRTALYRFLKRFGLDQVSGRISSEGQAPAFVPASATASTSTAPVEPRVMLPQVPSGTSAPPPTEWSAPPFCSDERSTPVPFSCCPRR